MERGLCATVDEARRLIWAGEVIVNGELSDQPAARVSTQAEIRLRRRRYATRGGEKLEEALAAFQVAIEGRRALDVGAAGGGFTDCLLAHGARLVYAVDVGRGQLAQRLRLDPRVVDLGGRDIMALEVEELDPPPTLAVVDVTFRSLSDVLPRVWGLLADQRQVVALVKPLHEAKLAGIALGDEAHRSVLAWLLRRLHASGLPVRDVIPSAASGPSAVEFLLDLEPPGRSEAELQERVEAAILQARAMPGRTPRPKRSGRKRRRTWRRISPGTA